MVLVVTDKTREFRALKEVEAQQNLLNLMSKVLRDEASFIRFAGTFEEALRREREAVSGSGDFRREELLRILDSMKSAAPFYSIRELFAELTALRPRSSRANSTAPPCWRGSTSSRGPSAGASRP